MAVIFPGLNMIKKMIEVSCNSQYRRAAELEHRSLGANQVDVE